ncbi:MAG: YafY family protein [Gallionella sp.]|jgi:predicted DNA-binding transcriptional regulator YafY
MNERIYKIDQLLSERRAVPFAEFLASLEISSATLKRDLTYMRDRLNAPIIYDRELGGYRFDKLNGLQGVQYALPGLWFSADEIHALLTMQHLLSNLDTGGLLGSHIQPLLSRLTALLGAADNPAVEVKKRVRIEMVGVRHLQLSHFGAVGSGLLLRKRLLIDYYARGTNQTSQREVSPQRLIYYRGNWYLDAWCHLRDDLRSFSVDAMRRVEILGKRALDVPETKLDEVLGSGYGIFAGKAVQWATLLFSPECARWVANERWHPNQKGRSHKDGSYELKLPYSNDTELLMDILKYGAGVKVLAPMELVARVSKEINAMRAAYAGHDQNVSGGV